MSDEINEEDDKRASKKCLEGILYQYVNLYELWEQDHQAFFKQSEALSLLLESVRSEVGRLEKIEDGVRKSLGAQLGTVVNAVKKEIVGIATEEVKKELKGITVRLEATVSHAKEKLENSFSSLKTIGWKLFLSTICVGVISSFVVTESVISDHLARLSDQRKRIRTIEDDFILAYNELSKKEQKKIQAKINSIRKQ